MIFRNALRYVIFKQYCTAEKQLIFYTLLNGF